MATHHTPVVPTGGGAETSDAAVQRQWRMPLSMSSLTSACEHFLNASGFDRGPWLVVAFAAGIASWFMLGSPWQWTAAIGAGLLVALSGAAIWREAEVPHLRAACVTLGLMFAAGMAVIWLRSETVGAEPYERPRVQMLQGYVLEREDRPAEDRIRLTMAVRDAETAEARKIRINVPLDEAVTGMSEGATLRFRARLMPPAGPMLPGGYDFARAAWFQGLSATGSLIGEIEVVEALKSDSGIAKVQRALSGHVRGELGGAPGSIAAAFASGDRGAISRADEDAMRDAGLTHLLSISGLHVSAVIAAAYLLALKLLALWPTLVLRVRLPIVAAGVGALAGIGYTLLTGAEVPTVRSCVAALLVLIALALGREALSLRMVSVAAFLVLLLWPESLIGPSFQMSFSAVIAIVALHNTERVRAFLAPREESWLATVSRRGFMLLITGFVIEIALMPIVLFHFHRAGVYGAFANVIAIPLVTFVSMPLIAIALALDTIGLGWPVWWLVGQSLELLLAIAHWTAAQPGSVKLMPQMSWLAFALFLSGGLWLALWKGRRRLLGFVPAGVAAAMLLATPVPDILISRDGRHVGITMPTENGSQLVSLRDTRSDYARENLMELASVKSDPIPMAEWPSAHCTSEFCAMTLTRDGRDWELLMARNNMRVEERALAAACERADIVVADRWLPRSCQPRWLKADGKFLEQSGGLAVVLGEQSIVRVSDYQGQHGWWRAEPD
uniref:ComEC/Rec2 family competence protein n=1 Tax=uncultured Altererythrobacter sp. TaxID=500840 RepID=UPI0026227BF6|nr:ComEC/Rec2 family competence protein [uncultured Altererythrobacter sp.]